MQRPLDWFVIALSLAFLSLNYSLATRAPVAAPVYQPVANAKLMTFEADRVVVPAALRRERNLEFGYVTLESATQTQIAPAQLLN